MTKPLNQRPFYGRVPLPEARILQMVELYRAGNGLAEVARRTGSSTPAVERYLLARGVKIRTRGEGAALGLARKARLERIAAAAQRVFGHRYAPHAVAKPVALPPINDMFADDLAEWDDRPW